MPMPLLAATAQPPDGCPDGSLFATPMERFHLAARALRLAVLMAAAPQVFIS